MRPRTPGRPPRLLQASLRHCPRSPRPSTAACRTETQATSSAFELSRPVVLEHFATDPVLTTHRGDRGDREDKSDPARLGEILRHRPPDPVLLIHPRLSRKEDPAQSGQGVPASRFRLEAMEQGMAARYVWTLLGVSSRLRTVDPGSRAGLIGPTVVQAKCAGARSAGNPHATCDMAGDANQLTVRPVRNSQRKLGVTDAPDQRFGWRQSSTPSGPRRRESA